MAIAAAVRTATGGSGGHPAATAAPDGMARAAGREPSLGAVLVLAAEAAAPEMEA